VGQGTVAAQARMSPAERKKAMDEIRRKNEIRAREIKAAKVVLSYCRSAVYPPTQYVPGAITDELDRPNSKLELDWAFGYGGHNHQAKGSRIPGGNLPGAELQEIETGEIVFFTAAIVVMFDATLRQQRFYRGHDNMITSLCVHPDEVHVASGQRANPLKKCTYISVWSSGAEMEVWTPKGPSLKNAIDDKDYVAPKRVAKEKKRILVHNVEGIAAMDFSPDGCLLVVAYMDKTHTIAVYEWAKAAILVTAKGHANPITLVRFNPFQYYGIDKVQEDNRVYTIVSAGVRHVKLWVVQKGEALADKEEALKNKGKKVTKPFGGNNRGGESNAERREGQLRKEKIAPKAMRPLEWKIEGDVIEGCASKSGSSAGCTGLNSSDILSICFLPDGQGFGACLVGSADGNIYIYDQAESAEEIPMSAWLPIEDRIPGAKPKKKKKRKAKPHPGGASAKRKQQGPTEHAITAEDSHLELEWVYGFYDAGTSNVLFSDLSAKQLAFPAAGLGVVFDFEAHSQKFFKGHTDDVICIATHPRSQLIATGEIGKIPKVCIWSAVDMMCKAVLKGFHERGILLLAFSPANSDIIVTIGLDDDQMVAVYNWKKGTIIGQGPGGKQEIHACKFHPNGMEFVTCGAKHIKFWEIGDNGIDLTSENGKFGKICDPQSLHCIDFCYPDGKDEEDDETRTIHCITGADDGSIIEWEEDKAIDKATNGHNKGPCRSGACTTLFAYARGIVSGGNDGKVILWTHQLVPTFVFDLRGKDIEAFDVLVPEVRSVCVCKHKLVVACRSGDIVSVDLLKVQSSNEVDVTLLMDGHYGDGELWGLDTHPSNSVFVTCSDDRTLRSFNADTRRQIAATKLSARGRCAAFAPDGEHIVIGLANGAVEVWDDELENRMKLWRHSKEEISCVRYSPDGFSLAVGARDNFIYIYNVGAETYTKRAICKGHSSFVTHLDWSIDNQMLQTVDGSHERLTWSAIDGKKCFGSRAAAARWHTYTCIRGKTVTGIWPAGADGTDINEVCRSHGGWLIATSDDFGKVNTFKYPCFAIDDDESSDDDDDRRLAKKIYSGHASHVTCIRFSFDDKYLISTGGNDRCILQWRTNFQLDEEDLKQKPKKFRPVTWETVGWVAMTIQGAHAGKPVTAMCDGGREAQNNSPRFVSGGGDKTVRLWQQAATGGYGLPIQLLCVDVKCVPLDIMDVQLSEKFIVGSDLGSLVEIDLEVDTIVGRNAPPKSRQPRTILNGHCGSVTVVAPHPTRQLIATTSLDKTVRIWDIEQRKLLSMARLATKGLCSDWSATGDMLAIGLANGTVIVLNVDKSGKNLEIAFERSLRPVDKSAPRIKMPEKPNMKGPKGLKKPSFPEETKSPPPKRETPKDYGISCIQFSGDGQRMAVGTRSCRMFVFDAGAPEVLENNTRRVNDHFQLIAECKGHSAAIIHIDFSSDGAWIVSNCAGREILYWNAATGKQDRDALGKRDVKWTMTTCTFGWATQGVWRPSTEEELLQVDYGPSSDSQANWLKTLRKINAKPATAEFDRSSPGMKTKKVPPRNIASVCRSYSGKLLVAADDRQRIAMYRYPALPNSTPNLYSGHGYAASSVVFSCNDEYVVSVGGEDCTVLIWRHLKNHIAPDRKKKIRTSTLDNGAPLLEIEDAWLQLEDVSEETNGANMGLAWEYLENDSSALQPPPPELGLPDLISNMRLKLPDFQGSKTTTEPKGPPKIPPRRPKEQLSQGDEKNEENLSQSFEAQNPVPNEDGSMAPANVEENEGTADENAPESSQGDGKGKENPAQSLEAQNPVPNEDGSMAPANVEENEGTADENAPVST
jgi:WD40 repeat protein